MIDDNLIIHCYATVHESILVEIYVINMAAAAVLSVPHLIGPIINVCMGIMAIQRAYR